MRRRIYSSPSSGLEDVTGDPDRYDLELTAESYEQRWCRTSALYDEALWARYLAARDELDRVSREVRAALRFEPWDEVERELHAQSWEDDSDLDECRDRALEHAATFEACPDNCPYEFHHAHVSK